MKWYAVAEMDITDPSWIQDDVDNVTPLVEARVAGARNQLVLVAGEDVMGLAHDPGSDP